MCYLCPPDEYVDSNCACCNTATGPIVVAVEDGGINQSYKEFESAEAVLMYLRTLPTDEWEVTMAYLNGLPGAENRREGYTVAWWGDGDNSLTYLRPGVFRYDNLPLQHIVVLGGQGELYG